MWPVGAAVVAVIVVVIAQWVRRWRNPKCNGVLPPGSMGFPLIGETLQLLIPNRSLDLHPFIKERIQRYGPIFKSSVAGRPMVISADPEFNHHLFLQEGRSVEIWYLDSFSKLFKQDGESRTNAVGAVHRYVRSIVLNHFGSDPLKERLLPKMEKMINKILSNWSTQTSVDVKHGISNMIFNFTSKYMYGYDYEKSSDQISDKFTHLLESLMSFPLNIPGTAFHKCLKEQKKILKMMKDALNKKRNSPEKYHGDLLDQAIEDMENEEFLTEDFVVQLVFGLLFASFESISSALTLAFVLLLDHPSVVEDLTAEHEEILRQRENKDSSLTWDEYKSMTFTLQVVNEILRLANVAPGLLRRSFKDIEVNGYTIPAGWTIMVATSAQQLNPEIYKDPLAFNPWRWKDLDSNVTSKNFMPFGGGMRQCAGAEYSRVFMAAFLHVLVTKFRWSKIKGGEVGRAPFLNFGKGMHIKITQKQA